ncbi:MAG TPA: hypothetical protein VK607_16775, partial [Kofleriaceae bacterium]|nr:hypothetical protein [Kofleriaceae bacterium]
ALHVAWPAGAARPTLAFDRPVARARERGVRADEGSAFRSPVERAICDCWKQVFGGSVDYPGFARTEITCSGAYGAPDAGCVQRYRGGASCPELLACTRRDPSSPP